MLGYRKTKVSNAMVMVSVPELVTGRVGSAATHPTGRVAPLKVDMLLIYADTYVAPPIYMFFSN